MDALNGVNNKPQTSCICDSPIQPEGEYLKNAKAFSQVQNRKIIYPHSNQNNIITEENKFDFFYDVLFMCGGVYSIPPTHDTINESIKR